MRKSLILLLLLTGCTEPSLSPPDTAARDTHTTQDTEPTPTPDAPDTLRDIPAPPEDTALDAETADNDGMDAPLPDATTDVKDVLPELDVAPPPPTHFELAEHWAPVWYHDTDADNYAADYLTAIDFDGDFISNNNWENLESPNADLSAVVYWSIVETETHYFIVYATFHPRDWSFVCGVPLVDPCHENDMEGAIVVVRKTDAPHGTFELLYTEAHNTLHIFRNDPNITAKSTSSLESTGVTFEDESHPELYIESKGHGVCALYYSGTLHCNHDVSETPPKFGGGDGVVYRYKGVAEVPESGNDADVGYALVSLEDTLWAMRDDLCDGGCLFDKTFEYAGKKVPKAFDGDTFGNDKANPPWAWDDPSDGPVYRGDHFFRPAEALSTHVDVPGPISFNYVYNPFLFGL